MNAIASKPGLNTALAGPVYASRKRSIFEQQNLLDFQLGLPYIPAKGRCRLRQGNAEDDHSLDKPPVPEGSVSSKVAAHVNLLWGGWLPATAKLAGISSEGVAGHSGFQNMAYITPEELALRLANDNADSLVEVEHRAMRGRSKGAPDRSTDEREMIGTLAHFMPRHEVRDLTGAANKSIVDYKHGRVNGVVDEELKARVDSNIKDTKQKAFDAASTALMAAMGLLTPEKLGDLKATQLSAISKDMASVMRDVEPKKETEDRGVKVLIYAPGTRPESAYDVVEVNGRPEE